MKQILFITLAAFFFGCTKSDPIPAGEPDLNKHAIIKLDSIEDIGSDFVFIKGIIETHRITDIDTIIACWNTQPNPTIDHNTLSLTAEINSYFIFRISGLQPDENYYARLYVKFSDGSDKYSNELIFSPISITIVFEKEFLPYDGGYAAFVEKAIKTRSNNFIIGSQLLHKYNLEPKNAITKIDAEGEIIWNNVLSFETQHEKIELIIELENGTFIAFLSAYDYPSWVIHIVKLSSTGNIIWQDTYDNYFSQDFRYAYKPETNVIRFIANVYTAQYSDLKAWVLISINHDGEIIEEVFNDTFYTGPKYLFTGNNELLICENNLRLRKFDQLLNLVWESGGISSPPNSNIIDISELNPRNNLLVLNSYYDAVGLIVMDQEGNIINEFSKGWDQFIVWPTNTLRVSSNEYLLMSTKSYAPQFPFYTLTWLGKVSLEKGIIWQKEFGNAESNARNPRGQFIFQTSENEFIIFGHILRNYQDPYDDNIAKLWLSKIHISS